MTRATHTKHLLLTAAAIICVCRFASGAIIYVDSFSAGPYTGTSWTTAYNDLQDALAVAGSGDEIWVRAGTYVPTTIADRTATFQLKNGVSVYGGFNGTEFQRIDRQPVVNPTVLSGDLLLNDVGFSNNDENVYHIVTGSSGAVLDGFTIRGGNANGSGADGYGGGFYGDSGASAVINDCILEFNYASTYGGGLFCVEYSSPTLTDCLFRNNQSGSWGGALACYLNASPVLTRCRFESNTAAQNGGAVAALVQSSPIIVSCIFASNTAAAGGAFANADASTTTMTNCTFSGNYSTDAGGALYSQGSTAYLNVYNCLIWGNTTGGMAHAIYVANGTVFVYCCNIQGGLGGAGTDGMMTNGGGNINADPLFRNAASGDFRLLPGGGCIDAASGEYAPATDYAGNARYDDLDTLNTGLGTPAYADIGAYEWSPRIIYVNANTTGLNDGSSWVDGFNDLHDALAVAVAYDEIWIKAAVYRPHTTDRTVSFELVENVTIYGGFSGTETSRNERDWTTNLTILSGDLSDNDDVSAFPTINGNWENSFHVVKMNANNATLDGVIIRGGNSNVAGNYYGGGIYGSGQDPIIRNCVIEYNSADTGGAISFTSVGNGLLSDNRIQKNIASLAAGLYSGAATSLTIDRCDFNENIAPSGNGGAINFDSNTSRLQTVRNCIFIGNSANFGAGIFAYYSSLNLSNCTFTANTATQQAGALYLYNDSGLMNTIANSIFWNNQADTYAELMFYNMSAETNCKNCDITGGWSVGNVYIGSAINGGGIMNSDPLFTDVAANDVSLRYGSPCIDSGHGDYAPEFDFNDSARYDDPARPNSGSGSIPYTDIGAFEYQGGGSAPIIYVRSNAGGPYTGESWATAFMSLQDALGVAVAGDEIWVAMGTYKPHFSDRSVSFNLKSGVSIYGGFIGTETDRSERNFRQNETILSGDLSGNDSGFSNNGDNSYHVVIGENDATLDGFTIRGGNANYNSGYYIFGGGLLALSVSPLIRNCKFVSNASGGSASGGGAVYVLSASPAFINCRFVQNKADYLGGAVFGDMSSSLTLKNCLFWSNTARYGSAFATMNSTSSVVINSTFYNHHASGSSTAGGTLFIQSSSSVINSFVNCIVWNSSASDGTLVYSHDAHTSFTYCNIEGGWNGPGVSYTGTLTNDGGNINADPLFADAASGNFQLLTGSPCIDAAHGDYALPSDLFFNPRFDSISFNTGAGNPTYVDIGAFELQVDVQTYAIYGWIVCDDMSGVTISLTGDATRSATPDAFSNYTFTNLLPGDYTITISKTGYTASPASIDVTITNSDIFDGNVVLTALTGSQYIRGWIQIDGGAYLSGVSVALTGAANSTATTDSNGYYEFTHLSNGNYTVTPTMTGYDFNPVSRAIALTNGDSWGNAPFTALPTSGSSFAIYGAILNPGKMSYGDLTMTLTGPVSDSDASVIQTYSFSGLPNGEYIVRPVLNGYFFIPESRTVVLSGSNIGGMDFTISDHPAPVAMSGCETKSRRTTGALPFVTIAVLLVTACKRQRNQCNG